MKSLTAIHREILDLHNSINTPALILSETIMENNLRFAQQLCNQYAKSLRPHTKTHKSVQLAKRQLRFGACGITAAKLSEAEVMSKAGLNDIFIANQITHPLKLQKLRKLHEKIRLIIGIDDKAQVELLRPFFKDCAKPLEVRIEINCGQNRAGIFPGKNAVDLAAYIHKQAWLKLEGIYTHAGQAYGKMTAAEIEETGISEGECAQKTFLMFKENGMNIESVSVGSTPTLPYAVKNKYVTEVRPGNYIFLDTMQMDLWGAKAEQCALFIIATVTSHPQKDLLIIDAGSKVLTSDKTFKSEGYGVLLNIEGTVERLSEEHGIIRLHNETEIRIGMPVLIIPNHACPVVNLFDQYTVIDKNGKIGTLPVSARGKSQ